MLREKQNKKEQIACNVVVSFVGPPGSGKGTVAQKWSHNDTDVLTVSTGVLCRQAIDAGTEYGKQMAALVDKGQLVPDMVISQMVREWLSDHRNGHKVIVIDGYPRTEAQVNHWLGMMEVDFPSVQPRVIKFDLSDDTIVERISSRLECSVGSCRKVYTSLKLSSAEDCPSCGGGLRRRADDHPDVVRKRLGVYDGHEKKLLSAYERAGLGVEKYDVESVPFEDMLARFLDVFENQDGGQ